MRHYTSQKGIALLVSLIMLIVITLFGISSIRTVLVEERMTSNTYDRSLSFQGAEAALRIGEAAALAQSQTTQGGATVPNLGFPGGNGTYSGSISPCEKTNAYFTDANLCANGLCKTPDPNCPARWEVDAFNGWVNATGLSLGSAIAGTPQYFVEYLGGNFPCQPDQSTTSYLSCSRYRITARVTGNDRASVMLQSIFATE